MYAVVPCGGRSGRSSGAGISVRAKVMVVASGGGGGGVLVVVMVMAMVVVRRAAGSASRASFQRPFSRSCGRPRLQARVATAW